ncbi:O-methyltransferase, family 3, S-adenosyl-L-methionine-dependent methyltransferase [Artemisia annua]|uniref:O-methyltransferase, family 3, S-adenosyl-L-methionine-dependent methyltransferase n=1 Tax=Artemisia annua TaxID=35608 RepID=A0A2U1LNN0_ARTAN|nr:O-methyltransferase, family 3, S-adenosyl-L-methionine-dependent methyltransferase [Artemisia annua]
MDVLLPPNKKTRYWTFSATGLDIQAGQLGGPSWILGPVHLVTLHRPKSGHASQIPSFVNLHRNFHFEETPTSMKRHILLQTEELYQYILETSVYPREFEPLKEIRAVTATHQYAAMGTSPDSGQMMEMLLEINGARKTLELRVYTGYSLLLTALTLLDDGKSLNHVNFFDEVTGEDSDKPNDDDNITGTPLGNNDQDDHHWGDGSHSQPFDGPTIDHLENELGHSPGSDETTGVGEKIVAIDVNREYYEIGRPIIAKVGVEHKIDFIESEALSALDKLLEDPDNEGSFDFAFIDADKINYLNYHERVMKLLKVNGIIMYDNMLWGGTVVQPEESVHETEREGRTSVLKFNEAIAADPRVKIVMAPLGDGNTI